MNTPQQEDMEDRCARPSEMVERVARALCTNAYHGSPTAPDDVAQRFGGEFVPYWTLFTKDAHAAIEAMRVPTEAMCIAGEEAPMTYGDGHDPRDVWPRMIDAALSPAQRSSNPQQEERG